jgi:DNA polymerase-1
MDTENKRLVIIDGNSLINRAYYAIQRPMITKEGIYTQGIYGFLTMLNKILADYDPAYIAVAWDRKAPTFRHEEYAEYKAGRKRMPIELAMELPYMKDVLAAMRVEMLEIDGFEADDIIGTVARRGEAEGLEPFIITGDRDELQLATDRTRVLITKRGISEFEIYDADAMMERYGFTPQQFIDYKGLMGDSSDNIPGLPGVGEKTATKLLLQFGSVEAMIEHADEIESAKLRGKVQDNAQLAVMSKRLATIVTDVPIEIDFGRMKRQAPDIAQLVPLYKKLEFNTFLKKLDTASQSDSVIPAPEPESTATYFDADIFQTTVTGADGMQALETALREAADSGAPVALKVLGDNNHRARPQVYGIGVLTGDAYYYADIERSSELLESVVSALAGSGAPVIGHAIQPDLYMLGVPRLNLAFDTAVAQYLLDPSASNYSIKRLSLEYFGVDTQDEADFYKSVAQVDMLADNTEAYRTYALACCRAIRSLYAVLAPQLQEQGLTGVYNTAELPLIEPLAAMEKEGFDFDKDALTGVGVQLNEGIDSLTAEIHGIAGETFNINSPQQLGVILFEKLGLPGAKKTKTGYATGAEILEKIADAHPIAGKVLEYRTLAKLRSTYIDGLIPLVAADGRIHAHFQQTVAATGRISCTEPNLQNIPVRQELGRRIRKAFVPGSDEYILLGADYSQIELRILAHFSQDPALLDDFRQGADIHRRTAARVFGVAREEDVTPQQRSGAKAVNFGIIYGMSSFGLSEGLGITRKEAERYIEDYFAKHAAVKQYLDKCVADARESGHAVTLLGRRRAIPELGASNYMMRQLGERLAMNTPIQGSAADIMKLAMIAVHSELRARGLRSRVILQVHDELIIRAHRDELEEATAILKEKMESAYELSVPLAVDVNTGKSWYELK